VERNIIITGGGVNMTEVKIDIHCLIKPEELLATIKRLTELSDSYELSIEQGQSASLLPIVLHSSAIYVEEIFKTIEEVIDLDWCGGPFLKYMGHIAYGPWTRGLYASKGKIQPLTGMEFMQAQDKINREEGF
jgi:hypothetical protein